MDAAATLRDQALAVAHGFDSLAENLWAVADDLGYYAAAAFLSNATQERVDLAEEFAFNYIDGLAYLGVVLVFCYAGLGIIASFCIEMAASPLKMSSNLLVVNNFVGVFYLVTLAVVLSFELFFGVGSAAVCLSDPDVRTIKTLNYWQGKSNAAASTLEHYIYCDTVDPHHKEFNVMTASADVINRSVTEYLRYRTRRPCNQTMSPAFYTVMNESHRLFNLLEDFEADSECSVVHATYEKLVEDKICGELVDAAFVHVCLGFGMMFLLWFVLMLSSFQRQTIFESKKSVAKKKAVPAAGHSQPMNFNSMKTISQATTLYFGDHSIPKSPTEHELVKANKEEGMHWTWNPDI